MKLKEITDHLEVFAPLAYQEPYDNSGLIVGEKEMEISSAMISLDATPEVIDEAIAKGCNLVISHHPIVFKGLKRFNNADYVQKAVINAIKHDIALYAIHTNLDNVTGGVNSKIADLIGLNKKQILVPKSDLLAKLVVFVPVEHTGQLLDALYEAGAGEIGNYSNCSFRVEGKGTFKGNAKSSPVYGKSGVYEEVSENRVEVIFPTYLKSSILSGMRKGHVYEEIAFYLTDVENKYQEVGSGMVGELIEAIPFIEFLDHLKTSMGLEVIKYTKPASEKVKRVAVCGGSGSFLLGNALASNADVFITSDFKYHEFFDANAKISILDIGHYESERFTKDLIRDIISKKFPNFATYLTSINTNPVEYYY
jgi:dinuclear metal center YbgI/SA1388 family protein